ncbi:MAG: DUF4249 domain-containing protein [Bacteroidales bacterium]|nr:DUF4249 domain-containing protein [Bacteroidales bacterium]
MKVRFLIVLILLFLGCKENIPLDPSNNKNLIVIEGFLSNEAGPYTIKVSTSSNLDDPKVYPVSECQVAISDNQGLEEILSETEPGVYKSSKDGIKGIIGNKYKLSVTTKNNVKYESNYHELIEPIGIKLIYADTTSIEVLNDPERLKGYEFFVNTELAPSLETYLLWNITESYEYTVDYKLYAVFDGITHVVNQDTNLNFDDTYRCWETERINKIFTAEMASLTYPEISNKKLHFVGTDSKKLMIKYSILVNQFTIDEDTYCFWKAIEDQISADNFLYTSQPSNIVSNIKNIDNPEDIVLGYFTVASISQKRLFVDNQFSSFNYEKCFTITDPLIIYSMLRPIPRYFVINDDGDIGEVKLSCFDCTNNGGELTKPDFWINK